MRIAHQLSKLRLLVPARDSSFGKTPSRGFCLLPTDSADSHQFKGLRTATISGKSKTLERNPFDLVERDLVAGPIVELSRSGRFMRCDRLSIFNVTAVF